MKVYIIDHQPMYTLGLKEYLNQAFHSIAQIDTCPSYEFIEFDKIKKTDWLLINLEMFTQVFKEKLLQLSSENPGYKLLGLTDEENTEIIKYINLSVFDAVIMRNTIIDEINTISNTLTLNKKYFSPVISEIIHKLNGVKPKGVKYE